MQFELFNNSLHFNACAIHANCANSMIEIYHYISYNFIQQNILTLSFNPTSLK